MQFPPAPHNSYWQMQLLSCRRSCESEFKIPKGINWITLLFTPCCLNLSRIINKKTSRHMRQLGKTQPLKSTLYIARKETKPLWKKKVQSFRLIAVDYENKIVDEYLCMPPLSGQRLQSHNVSVMSSKISWEYKVDEYLCMPPLSGQRLQSHDTSKLLPSSCYITKECVVFDHCLLQHYN